MAAGVSLNKNISSVWQKILTTVNNALVYMDNPAAEMLHWSGNVKNMVEAGALAIIDLSSKRSGNESETKAVFIVTSVVHGQTLKDISTIIQSSDFQHCTLLCTVPETVNSFVKHNDNMEGSVFGELSLKMREWMGNPYSTVDIHHVALFASQLYPGLFFTPAFAHFFPILPCDTSRLQGFLRSTVGDKSHVFNCLSEVEMGLLPHNLQVKIKMFAAGLSSMFEIMDINEDCYGLGYISKLVASELANMPSARGRRKTASRRASLVLIDRTLDLVGPCVHTGDTLADKIINLLPRLPYHEVDVAVDMARLCASGSVTPDTVVPGSLAHANDPVAQVLLNSLFTKRQKEGLKDISRHLIDAVSKESLPLETKGLPSKVTPEHLQTLAEQFRGQPKAFHKHSALLQITMATINALQHKDSKSLQKLQAIEKILLSSALTEDSHNVIQEILALLETPKEDNSYSLEDIMLLLTFVFSLMGDEFYESPAEIEKLKNRIVDCLLSGNLTCDTPGYLGNEITEKTSRRKVSDAFEKLSGVGIAREELKQHRSLYQDETALEEASYNPLVKQIIDAIFSDDKPELIDIEFKSHGLKDYIKTGFSLFMNVSKPRPNGLPFLVLFVIGGITCSEVQQIREALAAHRCNIQVIIGSTQILKPGDIFQRVFCQENLFPPLTNEEYTT
ncbi:sec1 family domain-containing protein 2-like [Actinia tenebrosa]|uniref:Sec1 family domain-containing protein 2-like n=1 Tax=Actinia tenebrosa TaxID=6105 RepID=A0A6P8HWF8_ACTTE|nr:sec1 family domain-containing protein 2-like [Actinia tenebrosa]